MELLFDEPMVGQSRYGEYYLYSVKNGTDQEYSFFAPAEVNEQIKSLRKGDRFEITKLAEQKGTKIVTSYNVKVEKKNLESPVNEINKSNGTDYFYDLMLTSCKDAVRIQNELGGLMDAKSLAVTLFIARAKINGNGHS
ncbi:MAG: hypothetical protein IPH11_15495 [Ignavibacteriales bacterium]|nr:hypothetical protein [Ignavibacteriales bacterium]